MKCQSDGKLPLNENRNPVAMVPPLPLSSEEFSFAATEERREAPDFMPKRRILL